MRMLLQVVDKGRRCYEPMIQIRPLPPSHPSKAHAASSSLWGADMAVGQVKLYLLGQAVGTASLGGVQLQASPLCVKVPSYQLAGQGRGRAGSWHRHCLQWSLLWVALQSASLTHYQRCASF